MRARRDATEFEEAEAETGERIGMFGVLVEAGGETDGIREVESHRMHGTRRRLRGEESGEAGKAERGVVGCFRIEREKKRPGQRIEHALSPHSRSSVSRRRHSPPMKPSIGVKRDL